MSRPRIHPLPTYEEVAQRLCYDPTTGEFHRRKREGLRPIPVTVQAFGYRIISLAVVHPSMYLAHRLAWLLHYGEWPEGELDHRDGDKLNNRISNLRPATRNENMRNRPVYNKTGCKGAYLLANGRYAGRIYIEGRLTHLGCFDTAEEAGAAYNHAATRLHAEFANSFVIVRGEIAATIKFI